MLIFRVLWACNGAVGFIGQLGEACSGVVGFNVAMFLRPVREIFRPARPNVGASGKRFAPQAQNGQNMLFSGALGEFFRGNAAGGVVRGEFFADQQSWDPAGRVCCAVCLAAGPFYWQC